MISRIRLDAYGKSPSDVSDTLYPHADHIEQLLGVPVSRGEFVVQRQLAEPDDSPFAFSGRLILHPDIAPPPSLAAVQDKLARGEELTEQEAAVADAAVLYRPRLQSEVDAAPKGA